MIRECNDEYLAHFGVQGMKWGIRRYQNSDGTLTAKGRARMLEKARKYEGKANTSVATNYFARSRKAKLQQKARDARYEVKRSDLQKARAKTEKQKAEASRPKKVSDMSNEELQSAIDRMNLEVQYRSKYSELNPKKVSRGKKLVTDILETSVKNIGTQAATWALGVAVNNVINRATEGKYTDAVNPKKGQKDK